MVIIIGLILMLGETLFSDLCYVFYADLDIYTLEVFPEFFLPGLTDLIRVVLELLPIMILAVYVLGIHKVRGATLVLALTYGAMSLYYAWDTLLYVIDIIQYWNYYEPTALLYAAWNAIIAVILFAVAVTLPWHPTVGKIVAIIGTAVVLLMHIATCIDYVVWFCMDMLEYGYISTSPFFTLMWYDAIQWMLIALLILLCFNRFPKLFAERVPPMSSDLSPEEQLQELYRMREREEITAQEYRNRRAAILNVSESMV